MINAQNKKNVKTSSKIVDGVKCLQKIKNLSLDPSADLALSHPTLRRYRGQIRNFLGTQQPVVRVRTGITTLTTSGANLTQVVGMDVTGISGWSSWAALFDEYRVRRATLHIVPLYVGFGASATTLAAMPIVSVIDYDDATALASSSAAFQYDTLKSHFFGSMNPKVMTHLALPEGHPDLAWVTTASPTVPFWWKFWSVQTLVPSTAAVGTIWIEVELELRQVA